MRTLVGTSFVALYCAAFATAQPEIVDDFESLAAWTVAPSDGVRATIAPADGVHGKCLRLDFDFERGAGFCVIRRELERDLQKNYRFTFALRGAAPPNNLEFKLIDASGENVWWVNRRAYEFPSAWQTVRNQARHFSFAWGPSGGAPLTKLSAVEFAIASSSGGKGSVYIDELTFEALPEVSATTEPPTVQFSTRTDTSPPPANLPANGTLNWTPAAGDAAPTLTLDCRGVREFGGLALEWAPDAHAANYAILLSPDLERWQSTATVTGGNGGRDYVPIAGAEARGVRLQITPPATGRSCTLQSIRLMPAAFGESPNEMFAVIARESPRGWYPRYFLGQQPYWTVVGVPGGATEALIDPTALSRSTSSAAAWSPFCARTAS